MKKSQSGLSVSSQIKVPNNSSASSSSTNNNGVGKMDKKSDFIDILKKYFKCSLPGSRVGTQLWPVLSILRLGGNLPLVINPEKKEHYFESSIGNCQTLPCLTIATLFIVWWTTFILHCGFETSIGLFTASPEAHFVVSRKLNSILQPLIQISEIVTGWITCKWMADYLNNWQSFESHFNTVFKDVYRYKMNIRRFRDCLLIFYVIFPALLFMQHYEYFLPSELTFNSTAASIILTFAMVLFSCMEDIKILLMYRVTQENFRETKNGIIAQYKVTTAISKTPLGPEKVKQWIQLLNEIRNQHKLSCQIQTPHQLVSIALSVLLLSNNLFLFVNSLVSYSNDKADVSFLPVGIFTLVFLRLLFKCLMAEKVTEEEQSIAQEIIQMESSGANIFIKMEVRGILLQQRLLNNINHCITQLKFMYDLIVTKPTITSFANFLTFSKTFLLQDIEVGLWDCVEIEEVSAVCCSGSGKRSFAVCSFIATWIFYSPIILPVRSGHGNRSGASEQLIKSLWSIRCCCNQQLLTHL